MKPRYELPKRYGKGFAFIAQYKKWDIYFDEQRQRLWLAEGFGKSSAAVNYYTPLNPGHLAKDAWDFVEKWHNSKFRFDKTIAEAFYHALPIIEDPSISPNAQAFLSLRDEGSYK